MMIYEEIQHALLTLDITSKRRILYLAKLLERPVSSTLLSERDIVNAIDEEMTRTTPTGHEFTPYIKDRAEIGPCKVCGESRYNRRHIGVTS